MTFAVEQLLARLDGVKPAGGGWMAFCPAHPNTNTQALSVREGRNGGAVVHCFVGCSVDAIASAVNLKVADLFPDRIGRAAPFIPPPPRPDKPRIARSHSARPLGKLVCTYPYTDADGVLRYEVCRYDPKDFRVRQPKDTGGWAWHLPPKSELVLYNLPLVLEAIGLGRAVFLVEGEKDANNLTALGATATTNQGGSKKWQNSYTAALEGAHVVCFRDNDLPGWGHSAHVANALVRVVASLRLVLLPNLPPKGDVSDWIARGGTLLALDAIVQAHEPVKPAPKWKIATGWKR